MAAMSSKQSAEPNARVEEILTRFGIRSLPMPVDRIAKSLGAQLRFSPLDEELSGMIYINENTPIIGVNSLHHPNRQRFTIAHEIGHLELHRNLIFGKVHVDKQFPVQFTRLNRDAKSATGTETIEGGQPVCGGIVDADRVAQTGLGRQTVRHRRSRATRRACQEVPGQPASPRISKSGTCLHLDDSDSEGAMGFVFHDSLSRPRSQSVQAP